MKQENKFVLPEVWSIRVTDENLDLIQEFKSKTPNNDHASKWKYCEYNGIGSDDLSFPEITFDQFREHVLGEVKETMNLSVFNYKTNKYETIAHSESWAKPREVKKIIGYKLIKPEYKEAAELIAFNHIPNITNRSFIYQNGACFTEDCKVKDNLEEAGVMHWFSPVYDTSITLKSGVKLSEDDISEVKEILNTENRNKNLI